MEPMRIVAGDFGRLGYVILACETLQARMRAVKARFEQRFLGQFSTDAVRNRNIVKLLAEDIDVKRFFCSEELVGALQVHLGITEPVQTGPIVTHYTASDLTGNNYGLPYHQDWPSMGTSSKGVIAWTSIGDIGRGGPGLRIVPGSQLRGLWPGKQTDSGYVLDDQEIDDALDIEVEAGQVLLMSPFLVHRTRTSDQAGWKLSLSCRFDDFACEVWNRRNFVSAYRTAVDRTVYLSEAD
jgi:ectoine hydroxylase-related dioxygenase (phytanoyl-CoA dioxygenase family)